MKNLYYCVFFSILFSSSVCLASDETYQKQVRSFLKENLDDENFQEVKWYPALKLDTVYLWKPPPVEDRDVSDSRKWGQGYPNWWKKVDSKCTVIRFKFREKNRLGAWELSDLVFVIFSGMRGDGAIGGDEIYNVRLPPKVKNPDDNYYQFDTPPSNKPAIIEAMDSLTKKRTATPKKNNTKDKH